MSSFTNSEYSDTSKNLLKTNFNNNEPTTSFENDGQIVFYNRDLSWKKSILYKLTGTHSLTNNKKFNFINLLQRCEVKKN